jgi:hypothetical protein
MNLTVLGKEAEFYGEKNPHYEAVSACTPDASYCGTASFELMQKRLAHDALVKRTIRYRLEWEMVLHRDKALLPALVRVRKLLSLIRHGRRELPAHHRHERRCGSIEPAAGVLRQIYADAPGQGSVVCCVEHGIACPLTKSTRFSAKNLRMRWNCGRQLEFQHKR